MLWGFRNIVPEAGQKQLLLELHAGHQGMAKMKSVACSFFGGLVWTQRLKVWQGNANCVSSLAVYHLRTLEPLGLANCSLVKDPS